MEERRKCSQTLTSTKLRANYYRWAIGNGLFKNEAACIAFFTGYQAHHIIPKAVVYKLFDRKLITSQKEVDEFDEAWNCIMISASKEASLRHRGSHEDYSNMVIEQILNHDNVETLRFMERCHNYVYAMFLQMEEIQKDSSGTVFVAVKDLRTFLDHYYEKLSEEGLANEVDE